MPKPLILRTDSKKNLENPGKCAIVNELCKVCLISEAKFSARTSGRAFFFEKQGELI